MERKKEIFGEFEMCEKKINLWETHVFFQSNSVEFLEFPFNSIQHSNKGKWLRKNWKIDVWERQRRSSPFHSYSETENKQRKTMSIQQKVAVGIHFQYSIKVKCDEFPAELNLSVGVNVKPTQLLLSMVVVHILQPYPIECNTLA